MQSRASKFLPITLAFVRTTAIRIKFRFECDDLWATRTVLWSERYVCQYATTIVLFERPVFCHMINVFMFGPRPIILAFGQSSVNVAEIIRSA